MRGMHLDHVKGRRLGRAHGLHELVAHPVHIGAVHRLWHRIARLQRLGRGRQQRPVALFPRQVAALSRQPGRALAPGMADLGAEFRLGLGTGEIGQALPGDFLIGADAGSAGGKCGLAC